MESHPRRRVPLLIVLAILLLQVVGARFAFADDPPYTPSPVDVWVGTNTDGVNVDANTTGSAPGTGTGTQASGGSAPKCVLHEVPASEMDEDLTMEYFARRMQYAPYYLVCNGQRQGIVWIEITLPGPNNSAPSRDPADIARELRDHIPIPRVTVDINPGRGVVGVESWFWIAGYNGRPISNSTNAFGQLVEVQAQVTKYEWSFGDGVTVVSYSPGRAYPQRSDVRHVFQRSSARLPDGYPVVVDFVFGVRYRVAGGSWIELPGITRTWQANYPVRESQAVIGQ